MVPRKTQVRENAAMMSSRTRLRSSWLGLTVLLVTTFSLAFAATSQAQVLSDPRVAEFDPSPDHWATLNSGESAVLRYELAVYPLGVSAQVGTVDMGKPSPEADGKIRFDFSSHVAAWSLPGGEDRSPRQRHRSRGRGTQRPVEPVHLLVRLHVPLLIERHDGVGVGIGRQLRGGRLHRYGLRLGRHERPPMGECVDGRRFGQRDGAT